MYEQTIREVDTVFNKRVKIKYRRDTNDYDVINSVMISDEYLAHTIPYKNGDHFIDLGAHIGTWSVLMASMNPTFTVHAYEPIPENFELLRENITINGLDNIKAYQLAVHPHPTLWKYINIFYTYDATPFGKIHKFVGSDSGMGQSIEVKTISLDNILDDMDKCKVIKSDCEGCEAKSFEWVCEENLNKIDYIIGEFHTRGHMDFDWFAELLKPKFIDLSESYYSIEGGNLRRFIFRRI